MLINNLHEQIVCVSMHNLNLSHHCWDMGTDGIHKDECVLLSVEQYCHVRHIVKHCIHC